MLTIWGRTSSINVQKAVWAAAETGQPFERIDAGGPFGRNRTPEYLAMNPNGQVPVLVDGDFVLWESNAVARYLARRYAPALMPADPQAAARVDQWLDWQCTALTPAANPAFVQRFRTPEESRDRALMEASIAKALPLVAILDAHLAESAHVAGPDFSVADVALGCAVNRWLMLEADEAPRPHLLRWFGEIGRRPASRVVLDLPRA